MTGLIDCTQLKRRSVKNNTTRSTAQKDNLQEDVRLTRHGVKSDKSETRTPKLMPEMGK